MTAAYQPAPQMGYVDRIRTLLGGRTVLILVAFLYRYLLEVGYRESIAPIFGYAGFFYSPDRSMVLLTYALIFLFVAVLPRRPEPSSIGLQIFFLFFFIPFSMFVSAIGQVRNFYFMIVGFFAIMAFIATFWRARPGQMLPVRYGTQLFIFMGIGTVATTLVAYIALGGLEYTNFDIENVYAVREDINQILTGPLGYLADWCKNVILPAFLILALAKKSPVLIMSALAMFVIFFGVTSAKSVVRLFRCWILVFLFQSADENCYSSLIFRCCRDCAALQSFLCFPRPEFLDFADSVARLCRSGAGCR
ncbi:MAG: hypothetical protein U5J78_06300 [Parasphingorhabdus sp.]|nr:hypothetical protein [Parasphingorhabdus sp.]